MSEARRAGFTVLRLTLAALGLTLGWCALTSLVGVDAAHADDNAASQFAPPPASETADATGEASPASTVDAVASSAMPALEAVAATVKTVNPLPVPITEPVKAVAPYGHPPAESVDSLLRAAAEPIGPSTRLVIAPVTITILEPARAVLEPAPLPGAPAPPHEPAAAELAAEHASAPAPAPALAAGGAAAASTATVDDLIVLSPAWTMRQTPRAGDSLPAGPSLHPGSTPD